jgi:succinate dehydrogenase flavin-adding protein (antitoxin of CptAB toxin-antitoxin module)
MDDDAPVDERSLSKLKWRCRRGLLENDLLIGRFFAQYESALTVGQARGLGELMELADNDLLDLLLRKSEPGAIELSQETRKVLELLRVPAAPVVGH